MEILVNAPRLPPQADAVLQSLNDLAVSPSDLFCDQGPPVSSCRFSDTHRARFSRYGVAQVAIKKLRLTLEVTRRSQIYLRMLRQLRIWAQLRHEGIQPLIGFHIDDLHSEAWLISPWQPNGDLLGYLSTHDIRIVDRLRLCTQVAEVVKYLHEQKPPIFHGDLKASNILVTGSRTAVLTGFGLAETMYEFESGLTTSGGLRASIRWTSPELLTETIPRRSAKSDAWAFGCLLLEVLADMAPFRECLTDIAAILQITRGGLPAPLDSLALTRNLRTLLKRCWSRIPESRPSIDECLCTLRDAGLHYDSQEIATCQYDVPLPLDDGVLVSITECSQGRFSDISKALWHRQNKPSIDVAVKRLVQCVDGTKGLTVAEARERWYREGERWACLWNDLKHSRILPILAFSSKPPPYVLSPWCEYGDLRSYLQQNPSIDIPGKIRMLIQVGEGILALHTHQPPIIHGNVHATNILVYAPGQTYLAGFSQARFLDEVDQHTSSGLTTGADEFSPSYVVPEVAKESPLTQATDVYSFACLILECLSGNPPFYHLTRSVVVLKILLCQELPAYVDHPQLPAFDPLWQMLRKAWDIDPFERPTMMDILAALQERLSHSSKSTPAIQPPSIGTWPLHTVGSPEIEVGQGSMDIGELAGKIVVNDDSPIFRGGFGDVYRGEWTVDGKKRIVAVKSLRAVAVNPNGSDQRSVAMRNRLDMRFKHEALIWSKLCHPQIVPFFGIKLEGRPVLVSKWYENGTLGDYIKAHPELPCVRRFDFVVQTGQALAYLHSRTPPICHGDVKPNNVLLNEDMLVGLADFGLSQLVVDAPNALETGIGTKGYLAPELIRGTPNTLASDVYAFGSFALSILSGEAPFYQLNPQQSLLAVNEGAKPSRHSHPLLRDDNPVWVLLEQCWNEDPAERPTMENVIQNLVELQNAPQFVK